MTDEPNPARTTRAPTARKAPAAKRAPVAKRTAAAPAGKAPAAAGKATVAKAVAAKKTSAAAKTSAADKRAPSATKAPARKAPATKAPAAKAPATKAPAAKAPATRAPSATKAPAEPGPAAARRRAMAGGHLDAAGEAEAFDLWFETPEFEPEPEERLEELASARKGPLGFAASTFLRFDARAAQVRSSAADGTFKSRLTRALDRWAEREAVGQERLEQRMLPRRWRA